MYSASLMTTDCKTDCLYLFNCLPYAGQSCQT